MLRAVCLALCLVLASPRLVTPGVLTLRGGEDLRKLPLSVLRNKAITTLRLPQEEVDEALDSHAPRQNLVELIERNMEHTRALTLSQLCTRAVKTLALPEEKVNAALDQPNPRQSLIALIEARERQELHVITYATHKQGLLERLQHNEFGIAVATLGLGETWRGYMHSKMRAVLEYVKALPPERVVVYLDAFDTLILKETRGLVRDFKKKGCEVLVSEDPYIMSPALTKLRFGAGNVLERMDGDRAVANAGMFMGYAGSLVTLIERLFAMGFKDDQIALNKAVQESGDAILVDLEHDIFHNANKTSDRELLDDAERAQRCGAYFISFPFGNAEDWEGWAKRVQRDAVFHVLGLFTGDK